MEKNQRRFRLVAVLLGCTLAVPVLALPASGVTSDGGFYIHAWNTEEPTVEAYAGIKKLKKNADGSWSPVGESSDPGSGSGSGGTPGDGNSDSGSGGTPGGGNGQEPGSGEVPPAGDTVTVMSRGPMSFTVTEGMIAFSDANMKAAAEGRTADLKTYPGGGWQTLWTAKINSAGTDYDFVPMSSEDSSPFLVALNETTDALNLDSIMGMQLKNYKTTLSGYYSTVEAYDFRDVNSGKPYYYASGAYGDGTYIGEGRVVTENGQRVAVAIEVYYNQLNSIVVRRSPDPRDNFGTAVLSDGLPAQAQFDRDTKKLKELTLAFPSGSPYGTGGYIRMASDGGYTLIYSSRADGGPGRLVYDSSDRLVAASPDSYDSSPRAISSPEEYNRVFGGNWNGEHQKPSDYSQSIPFLPTGAK